MILPGYKTNYETLLRAAKAGDLALVECTSIETGEPVFVICSVHVSDGEYVMTPLAKMFDGNPYEEVAPPSSERPENES